MSHNAIWLFIVVGCLMAMGGSSCSAGGGDVEVVVNSEPALSTPPVVAEPEPAIDHTIASYELCESVSPEGLLHRTVSAITLVEAPPATSTEEVIETAEEVMAMNPDLAGLPEGSGRFVFVEVVATSDHDVVVFEREIDTEYGPFEGVGRAHFFFDEAGFLDEIVLYFQLP